MQFYCPHALADGIRIREKTLEFSSSMCYLHCLCSLYHIYTIKSGLIIPGTILIVLSIQF